MSSVLQYVLAVTLAINAANGLKCYTCNSKDSEQCKWGFTSFTYNTKVCGSAGFLDKLNPPKCYKISAQSKDGREYIARGCYPPLPFDCTAVAQLVGWIASNISTEGRSLENLSCETCITDTCNSANRIFSFAFIGLFLAVIAFLF